MLIRPPQENSLFPISLTSKIQAGRRFIIYYPLFIMDFTGKNVAKISEQLAKKALIFECFTGEMTKCEVKGAHNYIVWLHLSLS